MKSRSNDFHKQLKGLSKKGKRDAFKWIDSFTPKEIAKFEQRVRIQLAQALFEEYMKRTKVKREKGNHNLKER